MVEQGNKQVRVDNWGTFFLQRLQVFFAKTDYCDLTLQFNGNVQLKVHRLVMNACTEYFRFLEETCPAMEDNTIIMPHDLQSDVIVPIVNFMYTGMLEFHVSLYEKLFKAAEIMNIHILTKLLEAQKIPQKSVRPKSDPPQIRKQQPIKSPRLLELPTPSCSSSRKMWKRKPVQQIGSPVPTTHPTSQLQFDQKWSNVVSDPLADNTPKPTRFEWPDDELPNMGLLDTTFEDISYTSKPLLTKEEEEKIKPSFDDLRNNVELPKKMVTKPTSNEVNLKEMEEFAKEQKIRNAMFEEGETFYFCLSLFLRVLFNNFFLVGEFNDVGQKRKNEPNSPLKFAAKKIKTNNKENKETTISVETVSTTDIDHTKIVTEILKKYPDLVKKNKNIKLKIMPGNKETSDNKKITAVVEPAKLSPPAHMEVKIQKHQYQKQPAKKPKLKPVEDEDEGPWVCKKCLGVNGGVHEFVLYYLYRKHMTDVHDEVFDAQLCKYCGRRCRTHNLMVYHLYTKHTLKPPSSYNFPKCNKCAYIAISPAKLLKHKELHDENEMQCQDCQLAFLSAQYLATHVRMTGHYSKPGKVCYDCQYCMKKLQSGIALFTHVRKCHITEAKRDGIVCLDEVENLEDLEDDEDDDDETGEYIIRENINENMIQKDKVKIISNVKVSHNQQNAHDGQQTQLVPIETSSEAEALNNVVSGIGTGLNLVDIVVLDENQQYILQQDSQNEQAEFIIPDLAHGQPFSGQVITTQDNTVIQQSMIQSSTGDITSTDELVMVLTDHDYPDGQEGENPDNSNIVVLYSHPVDGQEGQFITSQGNLLVNSQTGMLELRNSSAIASTTSSQMIVTNSIDTPIESIEMIQREIDNHTELKQEPYYEEERKSNTRCEISNPPQSNVQNIDTISVTEIEQLQTTDKPATEEESTIVETEIPCQESIEEAQEQHQEVCEEKDTGDQDQVDSTLEVSTEESMEVSDVEHKTAETEYHEESMEHEQTTLPENKTISDTPQTIETAQESEEQDNGYEENTNDDEEVDVPPEKSLSDDNNEEIFNDTSISDEPLKSDEEKEQSEVESHDQGEPMEVDGQIEKLEHIEIVHQDDNIESPQKIQAADKEVQESTNEDLEPGGDQEESVRNPEENGLDVQDNTSTVEIEDTEHTEIEMEESEKETQNTEEISQTTQENGTIAEQSQIDDDTKTKTDEERTIPSSPKPVQRKTSTDINKTILDDWEDDTDSQQSEKVAECESSESQDVQVSNQETIQSAVDNVNKLMDDWEEEDEEEKKG
ncbi:centrosome-associated zinc finger protein CP190 isoform X2 [Diorhabda carinulata]|uniref:centrosome-associated zinc finger protein CP190 isoform X2 n=1 Tax=Diorhabda carinulata TaxID=1163345 RepID=UPI0025A2C3DF|nr:centrosome-associated zinc finger protein CP190 isoform X2 [Diorhabda carinulata]